MIDINLKTGELIKAIQYLDDIKISARRINHWFKIGLLISHSAKRGKGFHHYFKLEDIILIRVYLLIHQAGIILSEKTLRDIIKNIRSIEINKMKIMGTCNIYLSLYVGISLSMHKIVSTTMQYLRKK